MFKLHFVQRTTRKRCLAGWRFSRETQEAPEWGSWQFVDLAKKLAEEAWYGLLRCETCSLYVNAQYPSDESRSCYGQSICHAFTNWFVNVCFLKWALHEGEKENIKERLQRFTSESRQSTLPCCKQLSALGNKLYSNTWRKENLNVLGGTLNFCRKPSGVHIFAANRRKPK